MEGDKIVEMHDIVKNFPGVCALDHVNFDLNKGEIHVLVGENGAGKSTLVKILAGVLPLDSGAITIDGNPVSISNPSQAQRLGIGTVFQESNLSPYLTVAQNIFIKHENIRIGFIVDVKEETSRAKELLESLAIDVDPDEIVANLSLAKQQLVAFARSLSFNPRVIILDEPTSSLTQQDTKLMFSVLKKLKERGVSIVYISHRLDELFQIGDRITVLRDGKKIDTFEVSKTEMPVIIRMMVGRDISEMYPKKPTTFGREALRLENVSRKGVCQDINLYVREGEVVGLFGLVGSGRTETMRLAFGLDTMDQGSVYLRGEKMSHISPSKSVGLGLGFSPEDRKHEGLCLALSVKENIGRASLDKLFSKGFVNGRRERAIAYKYIRELSIATPSADRLALYLSGGTQQKVVLAQWLCAESSVLILDEPTRGIDVGTKVEIYQIINQLALRGNAIIVISSELPEIMGISDRIYVMCRGVITGELSRREANAELIASYAFGVQETGHENHH